MGPSVGNDDETQAPGNELAHVPGLKKYIGYLFRIGKLTGSGHAFLTQVIAQKFDAIF